MLIYPHYNLYTPNYDEGVRYGSQISYILPGGYATVGAAAFSGAVTHTISISVIVFEMTGQERKFKPLYHAVNLTYTYLYLLVNSYNYFIMTKFMHCVLGYPVSTQFS